MSLREITQDPEANPSARASAARTLAELDGLLGKHQQAPTRGDRALSSLSREELVAELGRLRAVCARDNAPKGG